MFRKVVGATVVLAVFVGVALAEDISGRIRKIEGDKLTFEKSTGEKGKYEDAKTYDLAKEVKVTKGKDMAAVDGGLKAEALTKIDAKKGVGATITVTDGKVTAINIKGGGKKP